jgi:protein-S-isoprenylcysteine O-methyltransferase Ste14
MAAPSIDPNSADAAVRPAGVGSAAVWVGRAVFRYRDYLVPTVLVAMLVLTRPHVPFESARANAWLDVFGFLVAASGQALRIMVIGYAYIHQRGGRKKQITADRVVDHGMYALCRNPLYVGNSLILTGLALIYNSPWVYLLVLPIGVIGLLSMVKAEERYLAERFGIAYASYCARVNRFVPRLSGLGDAVRNLPFNWQRVVCKEYGTAFAWLSGVFFLAAWKRLQHYGWTAAAPDLRLLLCLYAPIPVVYAVVRWLKKSRRLRSEES